MKILRKVTKQDLKDRLKNIDLSDPLLYEQLNQTTYSIFQFSGNTGTSMCKQIHPDNFDEACALNALSRPGSSFALPDYCESKRINSKKYPDQINQFLIDTHGIILYQEQIMAISSYISNGKLDPNYIRGLLKKLGKANAKQEDKDKWGECVEIMKEEAPKLGLSSRDVDDICTDMLTLSKYSFNKSHCCAYSYIAMETVYLSKYFKTYYYAASLAYDATKKDALKDSIQLVSEEGYKISPPNVNTSNMHFTPNGNIINFGLNEIKGVGESPVIDIIQNRPYDSIIDFVIKNLGNKSITKRVTSALVHGGAFDELIGKDRKYYEEVVDKFYEKKKTIKTVPLLMEKWEESCKEIQKKDTTPEDYMNDETEYLGGLFFHGIFGDSMKEKIELLYKKGLCLHNFDEIRKKNLPKQRVPIHLNSYRYHTQKNGKEMLFAEIEDCNGEKCSVPIFGNYWDYCKLNFFAEGFYFMDLYPDENGKIMFGSRGWVKNPETIKNMLIRWKI